MDYIHVGPKCYLECSYEREAEENQTQIHNGGGGTTETYTRVIWSQVNQCRKLPEETKNGFSPRVFLG